MKFQKPKASTGVILTVFIQDSSATDGSGLSGLTEASSITGGYVKRDGTGVALTVNQNVTTEGTYQAPSTAAQVRIGTPANMPAGFYELHFHNDLFTTADWVTMGFSGAANMAPLTLEIQLTGVDLNDAVRGGMTSLPNAAAQAVGGLYTRGTGAGQIKQIANGVIDANVVSAVAAFFQDCFTVNSGEVSGAEVEGSLILEIVKVAWDRVLTGATHNIATSAGRRLRGIQAFGDYANGALWFDSVNGTSGQVAYENATVQNPSNSLTDILALASSLNMVRIEVAPGSTLTLNATLAGFSVMGVNWTLALGGQDVSGSLFSGANVSGTGTGANEIGFHHCHFANVTLPPSDLQWCVLEATFTIGTAGNFFFENCESGVAGAGTAGLDFGGALNSSNVNLRNYIGGLEVQNMGAGTGTYRMSFDCPAGQIVFNANCSATSEIELRGNHRLTNNASGLTINDDARIDVGQINAEMDAALADYNGPTSDEFNARTLLAADYFDPAADDVAVVTLVTTTTTNTDMRGTDSAALASVWTAARAGALTDWIDGGRLDLLIDAVKAKTDGLSFTGSDVKATLNGEEVTVASASKTGYKLASDGVDLVVVEVGMNLRQAMAIKTAAAAGVLSGAATTTITILGAGVGTTRIVATVDADGNRSAVTLTLPS